MNHFIVLIFILLSIVGCGSTEPMENPEIPYGEYSKQEEQDILNKVDSLELSKDCIDEFISNYLHRLLKYCKETGGGNNIGGGCSHIAFALAITTSVVETALVACTTPKK